MHTWQPPSERPYLYTSPGEIAEMRRRLQLGEAHLGEALAQLLIQARKAAEQELPVFDHRFATALVFEGWGTGAVYTAVSQHSYWLHRYTDPALAAALIYRLVDDEAALAACRRVLLHFAAGYYFDIEHYDIAMNEAVFGMPLLYAYDLTYDHYTPAERVLVERFMGDMAGHILAGDKFWAKNHIGGYYNNHYGFHKLGLLSYGLHANRPDYVEYCFEPPFGLPELLAHGLRDDGLSLECSLSYHFALAEPILLAGRALRLAGWPRDIMQAPDDGSRSWRDMFTSILNLLLPDGILPVTGDNYGDLPALPREQYLLAYSIWREPRFLWAVRRAEREVDWLGAICGLLPLDASAVEQAPHPVTRLWPEHGYALLVREGQGGYFSPSTAACFISYGYGGIHGHRDKLAFELAANGRRWLVDAEGQPDHTRHAMTARINAEWNDHTLANNTVIVDGLKQGFLRENAAVRAFDPDTRRIELADETGALYAGVRQVRELQLEAHELTDLFTVTSDSEHTYEYMLHLARGSELQLPAGASAQPSAGDGPAYAWLRECVCLPLPAAGLTLTARLGESALRLHLSCSQPAELWSAVSPTNEAWQPPHFRAVWLRCRAPEAVFRAEFSW
ncbi:MAG: heparinase II/III domain-containing protein [Anaerolineae bacterium]